MTAEAATREARATFLSIVFCGGVGEREMVRRQETKKDEGGICRREVGDCETAVYKPRC